MRSVSSWLRIGSTAAVMLWLATSSAAGAQASPPPVSLTFSDAIQIAADNNPGVQSARYRVRAAESRISQARSGFLPQVYLTETFNRTTNPVGAFGTKLNQGTISQQDFDPDRLNSPEAINNFATVLALDWSVYSGGRTQIGLDQARKTRQVASLGLDRSRQEAIARTARAYVGLLLAIRQQRVLDRMIETAQSNLKLVRSRYDSGFVVKSDLLRAQVRLAELEQDRLQAASTVEIAQARLNETMGKDTDRIIDPVTPLENCRKLTGTQKHWIDQALASRPDLKGLQYRETIAKEEIKKSKSRHLPDLNLIGQYEINSENFSETAGNYTVGAVLRLNLYSGNRISARALEAQARLQQVQAMQKELTLGVRVQVQSAYLEAKSAWNRIQVAGAAVSQAEEGLRIVRNRYRNGLLTIVALLDSEVALQQTLVRHYQALHDYKVARVNLALAAGALDTDFQ